MVKMTKFHWNSRFKLFLHLQIPLLLFLCKNPAYILHIYAFASSSQYPVHIFGVPYINPCWCVSISSSVSFNFVFECNALTRSLSFLSVSVLNMLNRRKITWNVDLKNIVSTSVCITQHNDDEISDSVIIFNGTYFFFVASLSRGWDDTIFFLCLYFFRHHRASSVG